MSSTEKLDPEQIFEFVEAAHGNLEKVQAMLEQCPDLLLTQKEKSQETALQAASHMGNREIAEYLLSKGTPLDICAAAMLGLTDQVSDFLEKDPTLANANGAHSRSVFFHAALSGKTEIADLLLSHGSELKSMDRALQGAAASGHLEMVQWLLKHGAAEYMETQDFRKRTPLQAAVENGHNETADILRQHGPKDA